MNAYKACHWTFKFEIIDQGSLSPPIHTVMPLNNYLLKLIKDPKSDY